MHTYYVKHLPQALLGSSACILCEAFATHTVGVLREALATHTVGVLREAFATRTVGVLLREAFAAAGHHRKWRWKYFCVAY